MPDLYVAIVHDIFEEEPSRLVFASNCGFYRSEFHMIHSVLGTLEAIQKVALATRSNLHITHYTKEEWLKRPWLPDEPFGPVGEDPYAEEDPVANVPDIEAAEMELSREAGVQYPATPPRPDADDTESPF